MNDTTNPTDLTPQKINDLKSCLSRVIDLRNTFEGENYQIGGKNLTEISDYASRFHNTIAFVDHGDRDIFYTPHSFAVKRAEVIMELDAAAIKKAPATNKKKLLVAMDRYIKDVQHGMERIEKFKLKSSL